MKKTRYFRSANKFNVFMNFMAGNFFPLDDDATKFSLVSCLWWIAVWLLKGTYLVTDAMGTLYYAKLTADEAFKRAAAMAVLSTESIVPMIYLHLRRGYLRKLIRRYNDILIDSDDLRRNLRETIEPYTRALKISIFAYFSAGLAWKGTPLMYITEKENFTYSDYTLPAYYPGEPFTVGTFVAGVIFQIIGAWCMEFGKISIDVYLTYLIAVVSAQYKYVRVQISEAINRKYDENDDLSCVIALQKTGKMLTDLLAFHIGTTYFICILKFCFISFGIISYGTGNVDKISYLLYGLICVLQCFLLCSCIQELLEVSTSVTDDAFYESWYSTGRTAKKIFYTIQLSNQIECRLSAYRIVDLVVPTLALILNKSYSVRLLLLNVN